MPKLTIIKGPLKDQYFEFGHGTVFLGRHPRMNDISIADITVSRKHLKIFEIGEKIFVEDLNSKHGTKINGKLIKPGEGFQIEDGDIIKIGMTAIRLTDISGRGSLVGIGHTPQMTKREYTSDEGPHQERRSKKELELVYKVSELFKKRMDINKFSEKVLQLLLDSLPRIDNAIFFLRMNKKVQILEVIAKSYKKSIVKYSQKVVDRVIKDRKTVRMSNTDFESTDDYVDSKDTLEIRSILCVPIVRGDEILGAIYIDSKEPYGFRKEDQAMLISLTGPIAAAIENYWLATNSGSTGAINWKNNLSYFIKKIAFWQSK